MMYVADDWRRWMYDGVGWRHRMNEWMDGG